MPDEDGITSRETDGGLEIELAAGRRKPVVPAIVGLILVANAVWLLASARLNIQSVQALAVGTFCALVGVLFLYIAVYNLLVRQMIIVHPGRIVAVRAAPLYRWELSFDASDIAEILCKSDGASTISSPSGPSRSRTYFGIQVVRHNGSRAWIANNITQAARANQLTEEICRAAGVTQSGTAGKPQIPDKSNTFSSPQPGRP